MKPFLNKESYCFAYLWEKFHALSTETLRARTFDGPQIRRLMQDRDRKPRHDHWAKERPNGEGFEIV